MRPYDGRDSDAVCYWCLTSLNIGALSDMISDSDALTLSWFAAAFIVQVTACGSRDIGLLSKRGLLLRGNATSTERTTNL